MMARSGAVLAIDQGTTSTRGIVFGADLTLLSLAQRGTGKPVRPRRLELARRRANEAALQRHFRCELRFDAPHDLMVFDAATLSLPFVHRNAQLLAVLLPGLELALAQDDHARTLADDVRTALSATMSGDRPAIANDGVFLLLRPWRGARAFPTSIHRGFVSACGSDWKERVWTTQSIEPWSAPNSVCRSASNCSDCLAPHSCRGPCG